VHGYPAFRMSAPSASVFQAVIDRVGAVIAGRKTYDDSNGFAGGGPHPTAPLSRSLTPRPPTPGGPQQRFVITWIHDAIGQATAATAATGKDVALMAPAPSLPPWGRLLDEVIIHQVPILLGGGTPFFRTLPVKVQLRQLAMVEARGVTHLTFSVPR
jgi:hypothetical protein